jgi:acyl-[acyl-carrier-protein]-phospholipid O-acyltransferase/long-chain-fatty-acid--[acyl-carrier-protein] ligase
MVWRPYYESKALGWFFRLVRAIPVGGASSASLRQAREELQQGHVVCIFAEGAISRTGNLLPFKRGMEKIVEGLDVPVIPVHLQGVWGSIFSFQGGRFFWKLPRRIPYPVTISFGEPMPPTSAAWQVRQAIQELSAETGGTTATLPQRFIRTARRNWSRFAMADSTGRELTYGRALAGSLLLSRWAGHRCRDEQMIGVLLPASVAGALANIGISMARRVPVNLNFTAGPEAMAFAVARCHLATILTSRSFVAKAHLAPLPGMVFIEDILARQSNFTRLGVWIAARLLPARLLAMPAAPGSTATVIFSSGTTGEPKGVLLSHHNIASNIDSIRQVFPLTRADRIVGSLPFFHSFGFTVTIWLPVVSGGGVVYHPNPLDAKGIGALVAQYRGTFLLSTPTFCAGYVRKCTRAEFASLRYVLVGAEKLREPVREAFRQAFGIELLEGYGCTEMSPVVAVNTPDREAQTGSKPGTVGYPLPGVGVKIVDPATGRPLPPHSEGLLLVKGPNQMRGYLGRPDLTTEALAGGWYNTGDIAAIDDEGFLRIIDRLSRFSKIGGEMVPHLKVEEAIESVIGDARAVVVGVPDDKRGERLVVLHTSRLMTAQDLWRALAGCNLPRLWIPKPEDIVYVDDIPLLGTGKTDLRSAKILARTAAVNRGREAAVLAERRESCA